MLLEWRNDAETRVNSIKQDMITMDSHVAWLAESLQNPMRKLYIADEEGRAVGTVRVDTAGDAIQSFSWTVAPSSRGRGFGKAMVGLALQGLKGKIIARIKPQNIPSIKIVKVYGFKNIGERDGLSVWESIRK